jgi:hypothetical protein
MSTLYPYTFNGSSRLRSDKPDQTQFIQQSTKYSNHILTSYFSENSSNDFVKFAVEHPGIMFSGSTGASNGVGASNVDTDSMLRIKSDNARSLEKLSLQQRPYLSVPYLGRGSCDVTIESQLKQGDFVHNKKSVSTISEQSYIDNQMYPLIDGIRDTITNPRYLIQESALDGWTRGGTATRNHLPSANP